MSSSLSLLVPTEKPVSYNTQDYGGNDITCEGVTLKHIEKNIKARLRVIHALGGEFFVKSIPVVDTLQIMPVPESFMESAKSFDFPKGCALVQGEDATGRKFVIIRLLEKNTQQIVIDVILQRYRETCITAHWGHKGVKFYDGSLWIAHHLGKELDESYACKLDLITADIEKVMRGRHPQYTLNPA